MQLVTMSLRGRPVPGVVVGEEILDFGSATSACPEAALVPTSLRGLLAGGEAALGIVHRIVDQVRESADLQHRLQEAGSLTRFSEARLLSPIPDPAMVLCCSLNYREHLKEMNTPIPTKPAAFVKPISSIIGSGDPILLPKSNPGMVDWEGEFCAVIGKPCYNVAAADALDYVAGYTLLNDVSARDWIPALMASTGVMGPIHAWEQSILGKQFPTFCPIGPTLVTADEMPDPDDVVLTTTLNGQIMQSANTNDLVFGVRDLIAHYSQFYRFLPGDVISTGSPSGVGYGRNPKVFMKAGDTIQVTVGKIGTLANPIALA